MVADTGDSAVLGQPEALRRSFTVRVLLGPGTPGHENHFDCAKYRMVEGFE